VLAWQQHHKETTTHVRLYCAHGALLRCISCPLGTFFDVSPELDGMIAASRHGEIAVAVTELEESPLCCFHVMSVNDTQTFAFEQRLEHDTWYSGVAFSNRGLVCRTHARGEQLHFFR
jgi:hypothetical protein